MPSARHSSRGLSEALAAALVIGAMIAILLPTLTILPSMIQPRPPSQNVKTLFLQAASGYAEQTTFRAYAVLSNASGNLLLRIVVDSQRGLTISKVLILKPPYLLRIETSPSLPLRIPPGSEAVLNATLTQYSRILASGVATLIIQSSSGAVIRLPIVPASMLQNLAQNYQTSTNFTQSYAYTILSSSLRLSNANLSQSLSQLFYVGNITSNYSLLTVPTYSNPGKGMVSTYPMILALDLHNVVVWTGEYATFWGSGYIIVEPMNANMLFVGESGDGVDMVINMVNFYESYVGVTPNYYLGYCTEDGDCSYMNLYYFCPAGARIKIIGFEPEKASWNVWLSGYIYLDKPLGSFVYAKCWNGVCIGTNASGTYVYILPPDDDDWTYYGEMDSFLFYGFAKEVRIYCKVYPDAVPNGETSYEPYIFVGDYGLGYGIWFLTMDSSFGWYDDPNDELKGYEYTYDVEDGSLAPLVLIAKQPSINNSVVKAVDISVILAFMDNAADDAEGTTDNGSRPYVIVGLVDAETGRIVTKVSIPFSILTRVEDTYPPHIGIYSASFFIPVPSPTSVGNRLYLPFIAIQDPYFRDEYDYANDVDVVLGVLYFGVMLYGR